VRRGEVAVPGQLHHVELGQAVLEPAGDAGSPQIVKRALFDPGPTEDTVEPRLAVVNRTAAIGERRGTLLAPLLDAIVGELPASDLFFNHPLWATGASVSMRRMLEQFIELAIVPMTQH
jgi:hypothetical protein